MIPKAWKLAEIGDWLDEYRDKSTIQNQYAVLTSSRSGLIPQSEYYGDSRITTRDNIGFHVIPDRYITYRSRSDDGLFFFNRNETGKAGLISHYYPVFRFPLGSDDFFLAALNFWRHKFGAYAVGSSQKVLSLNALQSVRIPIPPLAEQKRIAEILSTWDRAIERTEKLIANSEAQKKALMQQLLTGKKRLPGFSGKWSRKHFRDAVDIDRNSLGQNTPANFKFRYVSLSDVSIGKIATNLPEVEFASAPSRARRKLDEHDILMATVRPNLQAFARVSKKHAECIASTGFAVLTAKSEYNPSYIYHYLFSEHLTGQIDALVVGSSYPAINSTDIQGLAIICPEEQEQAAIARVLNAFDAPIAEYQNQLSSLCQEKAALMQQLLTGKRRVKINGEAQAA